MNIPSPNDLLESLRLFGPPYDGYAAMLAVWVSGTAVTVIFRSLIIRPVRILSTKAEDEGALRAATENALLRLLRIGILYAGSTVPDMPENVRRIADGLFLAAVTFAAVSFLIRAGKLGFDTYLRRRGSRLSEHPARSVLPIAVVGVWLLAAAFLLDNYGFEVTAIVAGLGIAGIAVGLAAQAVLGDLFSYFAILLDRPFNLGDFIIMGDMMGSIEHIGLKTSRIRSLSGEQIVIPNSVLTGARVHNYRRMQERRAVFTFGVVYSTPHAALSTVPGTVRKIIEQTPQTRFDRAHFKGFGNSSLDFEVVYYVLSPDYAVYMDAQQSINLDLVKSFEADGIEFAFPTRTIHIAPTEDADV